MVFISYWASSYTVSDIQRFDNHCESHSALEVVYNAPMAIRYSVTGALKSLAPSKLGLKIAVCQELKPRYIVILSVFLHLFHFGACKIP